MRAIIQFLKIWMEYWIREFAIEMQASTQLSYNTYWWNNDEIAEVMIVIFVQKNWHKAKEMIKNIKQMIEQHLSI